MKLFTGKVSGISQETQITGASTVGNRFSSSTKMHFYNEIHFRIDNQPVHVKLDKKINVMDGEQVAVAGEDKKGVFRGYAMKNTSTGIVYTIHLFKLLFTAILGLGAGLLGIFIFIVGIGFNFSLIVMGLGGLMIYLSALFIFYAIKYIKANKVINDLR